MHWKLKNQTKRAFAKAASLTALAIFFLPQITFAWSIDSFKSDIKIEPNSKILVTETIQADYSVDPHHGLTRFIPIHYKDSIGNNLSLDFNLISITDEHGRSWNYEKSSSGDNVQFKIGDADVLLHKPATFVISYEIYGAITYFKDHDELYWNITGDKWDTYIKTASATITLPPNTPNDKIKVTCFTGYSGSTQQNCTTSVQKNSPSVTISSQAPNLPHLGPVSRHDRLKHCSSLPDLIGRHLLVEFCGRICDR